MTTEQFDFPVTEEHHALLRACRLGLARQHGFSPTDTVAMSVLCLKERGENITVASVLSYIKQHIWPTMVHDRPMAYGDVAFERMTTTYRALIRPVVRALKQDDLASELLRLDEQTNGRFAIDDDTWEE